MKYLCSLAVLGLALCGCNEPLKATNAEHRTEVLKINPFSGGIVDDPTGGTIDALCHPLSGGTELQCDVYNGLQKWHLSEVEFSIIADMREHDEPARRIRVAIHAPPLSSGKVDFVLGTKLAPDTFGPKGERFEHWAFAVTGAKAYKAE